MNRQPNWTRRDDELLWFRRRSFLQRATAWGLLGGFAGAHAQQRGNVIDLRGEVLVNGQVLAREQSVQTGDRIATGPGAHLVFVIGNSAFEVRENSRLTVERGQSLHAVSVLRLLSGAVASVWGRGESRSIVTPTATAGIRGTGVYAEVFPAQDNRTYLCNCYGTVDLQAGAESLVSTASYHQSFWAEAQPREGRLLRPAGAINHTDEELEYLAGLVDQRTAWQIAGVKGTKDGRGYLENQTPQAHPAATPPAPARTPN